MTAPRLSKECQRALRTLDTALERWDGTVTTPLVIDEENIVTGFTCFSHQTITLQRGDNWRWNRTSNLRGLEFSDQASINLQKMNSRSNVTGRPAPHYKLWIYDIIYTDKPPLYFVWCEYGKTPSDTEPTPTVLDYAFLRPYVSDSLAQEFKWPHSSP